MQTTRTKKTRTTSDLSLRFRTFEAVYKGPTNTRGSRVIIKDLRREKSKSIPYDHQFNSADDIAMAYLENLGIKISGLAMRGNDCLLLTEDFETELK